MYEINLTVGDFAQDGHGETETLHIRSSLPWEQLHEAYKVGTKQLGINVEEDIALAYQDDGMTRTQWEIFAKAGMTLDQLEPNEISETGTIIYLDVVSFGKLWLFTANVGNPELKYEFLVDATSYSIGGYGLFNGNGY